MPATDPLLTVSDGHLCFDGADLVDSPPTRETPFYRVQRAPPARQRRAVVGRRSGASIRATEVFYASKACSNLWFLRVVRDAGQQRRGQLRRRARQGAARGLRAAADRLQRGREDAGRDRARSRLPACAPSWSTRCTSWAGSARSRPAWARWPRWPRASTSTCRRSRTPASRPRTAARPASTATTPRPRSACAADHPRPRAGRPAPARRLADHERRAVPAGRRGGARPRRRGGGGRRRAPAVPRRRRRLRRAVP